MDSGQKGDRGQLRKGIGPVKYGRGTRGTGAANHHLEKLNIGEYS